MYVCDSERENLRERETEAERESPERVCGRELETESERETVDIEGENVLPTNGMRACTACIIEVSFCPLQSAEEIT